MLETNRLACEIGLFGPLPPMEEVTEPFSLTSIDLFSPPSPSRRFNVALPREKGVVWHFPAWGQRTKTPAYYISDYHLEFQLEEWGGEVTEESLTALVDRRLEEMLRGTPERTGVLLSGGDVAHSTALTTLFYDRLSNLWSGPILAITGNHELWDNHPRGTEHPRSVETVLADYRRHIDRMGARDVRRCLLENDLYLRFPDGRGRRVSEAQILSAREEELKELCAAASLAVLGGNGFTGLNPKFNASIGMYRDTLTSTAEDGALSERFGAVYEKLLRACPDQPLVIFTHTPMGNWTCREPHPPWIYVSGHTHQNQFSFRPDGAAVLCDNQIGYMDRPWYLCGFAFDQES